MYFGNLQITDIAKFTSFKSPKKNITIVRNNTSTKYYSNINKLTFRTKTGRKTDKQTPKYSNTYFLETRTLLQLSGSTDKGKTRRAPDITPPNPTT